MSPSDVDALEAEFERCEHSYVDRPWRSGDWCNVCGALFLGSGVAWAKPHWRDVLVKFLVAAGVALSVVSCTGGDVSCRHCWCCGIVDAGVEGGDP